MRSSYDARSDEWDSVSASGVWGFVCVELRSSALDDVVDGHDLRLAGIGPQLGHDRQQRLPEGLERLLGVPDVEHLDQAVRFESDVIEPASGRSCTSRFLSRLIASSYRAGVNELGEEYRPSAMATFLSVVRDWLSGEPAR